MDVRSVVEGYRYETGATGRLGGAEISAAGGAGSAETSEGRGLLYLCHLSGSDEGEYYLKVAAEKSREFCRCKGRGMHLCIPHEQDQKLFHPQG